MNFVKPERINLKLHPDLNEKWVQKLIADDPSILGLGDLVLRATERVQPRAGRLDLLLQDSEKRRYEVEIQLGETNESHIIRTLEYWDIEKKRYPQYDHCAVIIAEEITARFLNVIALLNGTIPLIAIQMQAFKVGDNCTLVFTTVMNEMSRGLVDEDEDAEAAPSDRAYWENRASKETVQLADDLLKLAKAHDPALELKYNKFYIGLARGGQPDNFVTFRPRRGAVLMEPRLPKTDETDSIIENAGLDALTYDGRWGRYRLSLQKDDIANKREALAALFNAAYTNRAG